MNLYILSTRGLESSVSYDPIFDLENVLVRTCNAQLLIPTARPLMQVTAGLPPLAVRVCHKAIKETTGLYQRPPELAEDDLRSHQTNVLLIITLGGGELELLNSIPNWRKKFDVVIAYVFDAWNAEIYSKNVYKLDHLFVPLPEVIDSLKAHLKIPVSYLPFGADVLGQGSDQLNRPIDLISFGRIPEQYDRAFFAAFNQPRSKYLYYRTIPRASEKFPQRPYEQRKDEQDSLQLYHLLRNSKLVLAFDTLYPGMRKFPYSFVTLRWFYGAAAGCAIVGKRPTTPAVDELLNWQDSTIELPDDPVESVEFIQTLLKDTSRLQSIYQRNYVESLTQHDWRLRIREMFERVEMALPQRLREELHELQGDLPEREYPLPLYPSVPHSR